jgi:hypothetical protein
MCPSVNGYEIMRIYGCIQNWLESVESSSGVIQCVHFDPLHYSVVGEVLMCVSRKKLQLVEWDQTFLFFPSYNAILFQVKSTSGSKYQIYNKESSNIYYRELCKDSAAVKEYHCPFHKRLRSLYKYATEYSRKY